MRTTALAVSEGRPHFEALEPRLLLDGVTEEQALELLSVSPALFVENRGQWADEAARYVHSGNGANVAMTDSGPVFQVFREVPREGADATPEDLADPLGPDRFDPDGYATEMLQFSAAFVGANAVTPVGLDRSETAFNYLVGGQENWHSDVPSYAEVAYQGLYDGVDLVTWGQRDSLKYEFRVAPGADFSRIQVRYEGIAGLALAEDGSPRSTRSEPRLLRNASGAITLDTIWSNASDLYALESTAVPIAEATPTIASAVQANTDGQSPVANADLQVVNALPAGNSASWVTTSPISFTFVESGLPCVQYGTEVAWGDYDNDGRLDILQTGGTDAGVVSGVYHNEGGGVFTDVSAGLQGGQYGSVAWGDYDNDGRLDILLTGDTASGGISRVYHNDGGGLFTDINAGLPGVGYGSAAWGDYDNDGRLDILLAGSGISSVYHNDGGGVFTDINPGLTGVSGGSSAAWGDYDNDGRLDILLTGSSISRVYHNDGGGVFTDINAGLAGVDSSSVAWGDYDNDGRLDILLTGGSAEGPISRVYHNEGGGVFSDINAGLPGTWWGSVAWGDYDNDGRLDFVLTGYSATEGALLSRVYHNDGGGVFTDINAGLPGMTWGSAAWGDYDNDGCLDLLLTGYGAGNQSGVYHSSGGTPNTAPSAPTGLSSTVSGAKVALHWDAAADGETPSDGLTYNLRVGTTPGADDIFSAMADLSTGGRRVPGMGNAQHNLSWTLKVPGSGTYYWSVQAIDSAFAGSTWAPEQELVVVLRPPTDISLSNGSVAENEPAGTMVGTFTTTDPDSGETFRYALVDGDGSEDNGDFYIAGDVLLTTMPLDYEARSSLSIRVQSMDSSDLTFEKVFTISVTDVTEMLRDVGAGLPGVQYGSEAWGDYDNDGRLDILLTGFADMVGFISRVYHNEGGGVFTDISAALPGTVQGSVAWGDYDNDGRLDILLTGYADMVGLISRVYHNEGGGVFTDINAALPGTVQGSVAWGDYDNDGRLDILLTGFSDTEGFVSRVYHNEGGGVFTDINAGLPGTYMGSGAWGDYDNDGRLDILLTGLSDTEGPISRVYHNEGGGVFTDISAALPGTVQGSVAWGDYDNDGRLDILLTGNADMVGFISRVYHNEGGGVFTDINAALPGTAGGSVAWGDYDNDGRLDFVLSGYSPTEGWLISRVYHNEGGGIFTDINAGLPGTYWGSVAWGDYDNDGRLDILIAGYSPYSSGFVISRVYHNDGDPLNSTPSEPTGLSATLSGDGVAFSWGAATDNETPSDGLTYNLRVGTTPGADDVFGAMADLSTGGRRVPGMGNVQHNLSWMVHGLASGTYYWSVQAIDSAFAGSPWAAEEQVLVIAPPDTTPPTVTRTAPAFIHGGGATWTPISQIVVAFSERLDVIDANAPANYELRNAGANGVFGDTDDTVYGLSPAYAAGSTAVALNIAGGAAQGGLYRLIVRGDTSIHDMAGNRLDGDGNGTEGGDYIRVFTIIVSCYWSGAEDSHWENADNWFGGTVPGPLDVAVIAGSATQPQLSQDQTAAGVDFQTADWTLGGNGFNLTVGFSGIDSAGEGENVVEPNVALGANSTWTVGDGNTLVLSGTLGGGGNTLTKDGAGTLVLDGGQDRSTGLSLTINGGTVKLGGGVLVLNGLDFGTLLGSGGSSAGSAFTTTTMEGAAPGRADMPVAAAAAQRPGDGAVPPPEAAILAADGRALGGMPGAESTAGGPAAIPMPVAGVAAAPPTAADATPNLIEPAVDGRARPDVDLLAQEEGTRAAGPSQPPHDVGDGLVDVLELADLVAPLSV